MAATELDPDVSPSTLVDTGRRLRADIRDLEGRSGTEAAAQLHALEEVEHRLLDQQEEAIRSGLDALLRIQDSMVRLRECTTPHELIRRAPAELCAALGFSRAMISRVKWSIWVPEHLEIVDGDGPRARIFHEWVERNTIPLSHLLMETELVRRRMAILITDAAGDPRTFKPIVEASRSTAYVAAPIMPADRVIGFFHADRYGRDTPVTAADRDNLWLFCEHFGLLYERAILVRRLESQRRELRQALLTAADAIDHICQDDIELARHETAPPAQARSRTGTRSRVEDLLSRREIEVLELMARGATNPQIATALVVTEGTVKSHVKRILRKLHASTRAEAVARYLRLMQLDDRLPRR